VKNCYPIRKTKGDISQFPNFLFKTLLTSCYTSRPNAFEVSAVKTFFPKLLTYLHTCLLTYIIILVTVFYYETERT